MTPQPRPRLKVLCPQEYDGTVMRVTSCDRCSNWSKSERRCTVYMGIEHLPLVRETKVPPCPLEARCQHQLQANPTPCPVRARGLLCESVVGEDHPLAFNEIMFR